MRRIAFVAVVVSTVAVIASVGKIGTWHIPIVHQWAYFGFG
jgi:hypothetical protein